MPLTPTDYRKTRYTHRRGTRADQPLATDVLNGTLYFVTDEEVLERSNGTIWESYSGITSSPDHVVMSDGNITNPQPVNNGAGSFIYIPYVP